MKNVLRHFFAVMAVTLFWSDDGMAVEPSVSQYTITLDQLLNLRGIGNPFSYGCGGEWYTVQAEGELNSTYIFMLDRRGPNERIMSQDHLSGWGTGTEIHTGTEYVASINENWSYVNWNGIDGEDQVRQTRWKIQFVSKSSGVPGFQLVVDLVEATILQDGTVVRDFSDVYFQCLGQ